MFTEQALKDLRQAETVQALGAAIVNSGCPDHMAPVPVPNDFRLKSLEQFAPVRFRPRGTMRTEQIAELKSFCDNHPIETPYENCAFVNQYGMQVQLILNYQNDKQAQGHCDFTALYAAKKTAAFAALEAFVKVGAQSQQATAEFLEDWLGQQGLSISFFPQMPNDEGTSQSIAPGAAIKAVRTIKIKSEGAQATTVGNLAAAKSTFESVAMDEAASFPAIWYWTCAPYVGFPERLFVVRLSLLTGDKPALKARVQAIDAHIEDMARDLADLVAKTLPDVPCILGTFDAGK